MTRDELKVLLEAQGDSEFIDRWIFTGRPWIFASAVEYRAWQTAVAATLAAGPDSVRVVGSAATGFSLSPLKPGRDFRKVAGPKYEQSDIDIALIDAPLFLSAWDTILLYDRRRALGGSIEARQKIRVDVYWGVVAQYNLPWNTDPARRLLGTMAVAGRSPPLRGHPVRCRVYRRIEDLYAYHVDSLRQLRAELSKP